MRRRFIFTLSILLSIFLFNFDSYSFAQADERIPGPQIRKEIEADFRENYLDSLNAVKEDYGLSESEDFTEAKLSHGRAFYTISDDVYNSDTNFSGYVFSIIVNEQDTGTIYSYNDSGQWKVSSISTFVYPDSAITAVETNLHPDEQLKLIDDIRYGLHALLIEGGDQERVMDLSTADKLNINNLNPSSNKTITKSLFDQKIKQIKSERSGPTTKDGAIIMGSASFDFNEPVTTTLSTPAILFVIGIFALVPIIIIGFKKRKS